MSSELLVDVGEDPATDQLGQLKLAPMEDPQWPPDELTLSKSGERTRLSTRVLDLSGPPAVALKEVTTWSFYFEGSFEVVRPHIAGFLRHISPAPSGRRPGDVLSQTPPPVLPAVKVSILYGTPQPP